ncbi:hypothetical protein AYO45_02340 [Gammaproteobacteria bacterium SCGC AG-212-F23]|nr:hypothetical protein AYO45_02340 [Gammaproteobacteria bacterium SCGC AG-212-F23]
MHLLGDALMQAGFSDPVMDVEYFSLNYRDKNKMARELWVTGMLSDINDFSPENNTATFEVVYGHAWGAAFGKVDESGVAKVPIDAIQRRVGDSPLRR